MSCICAVASIWRVDTKHDRRVDTKHGKGGEEFNTICIFCRAVSYVL